MSADDPPAGRDPDDRLLRLHAIGVALSAERDLTALLDRIVAEARAFTRADAGTLYLVAGDHLTFEVAQNDTLGVHGRMTVPPVPITPDSLSGHVALTGRTLAIDDVYAQTQFTGPRDYDRLTGYRTRSVLTVPLKDRDGQVVGVMQLINARPPGADGPVPFPPGDGPLVESLASQAAVAVVNAKLNKDTEELFEAFLRVMAGAIDERSPHTGGHIRRVTELTMALARAVHACGDGPLAGVTFTPDQLNELRMASWMHDLGKITTPEWIVAKPTRLTAVFDRIELVRTRFALIAQLIPAEARPALADDLAFVERANSPGKPQTEADLARLREIAGRTYLEDGVAKPYLTADELHHLSIRTGTLSPEERRTIQDHASATIRLLGQIPFPRKLGRVPAIAGAHHERLDGSGYPRGLTAGELDVRSRILALMDVFESLSAKDRPYRAKPLTRDDVFRILGEEVSVGRLDRDLYDLFVRERVDRYLDEIRAREASGQ